MTNGAIIALARKLGGGGGSKITVEELNVTANDTYTAPEGKAYSPVIVNVPTGGGGGGGSAVLQSGVNFIDYDGSLVKHYSKDEFLGLSAMPSNPSHDGLVAQGWNWSFADAKAYITKYGSLIIGQMYTTDTGDTRIYIHIDEDTPQNRLTFYVRFTSSVADNVTIDWGDGTVETKGSTTAKNYPHTYATGGEYVIKLKVNSGTISFVGSETGEFKGQSIYGNRAFTYSYNRSRITRIEIGNSVTDIGNSALYGCNSLTTITIPNSVTSIGTYALCICYSVKTLTIPNSVTSIGIHTFEGCHSLISIIIPNSVTNIGTYAFYGCYALQSAIIPDGVSSIESYVFSQCYSLTSIIISDGITNIKSNAINSCYSLTSIEVPSDVTSIGNSVFASCFGMSEYHLLPTTPPTLANTNAFNEIASDCKIYVPYSADHSILAAYQSATNWATYASKMVEEPQP